MNKTEKQLVELERKNNTAVFVGEVIEIIVPKTPSGKPALFAEVKFKVQKAWKGVGAEVVSVFTGNVCCICGFEFEVRETYLVYASGANRLTTSRCTRTRRLTDAEQDLKVLGKVKTPSKSKS